MAHHQDTCKSPFDAEDDYRQYVDGRTREDGVASFSGSRQIELPEGTFDDTVDQLTIYELAARKQEFPERALSEQGVRVFPDAAELLGRLRAENIPSALVTSSWHLTAALDVAGVTNLFTVRVVVLENAAVGVRAAAGRFGLAAGADRGADGEQLLSAGRV